MADLFADLLLSVPTSVDETASWIRIVFGVACLMPLAGRVRGRRAEALRDPTFDLGARPTLQPDFTNLNGGLGVGVVGDVGKDRLGVRSEGGLKCIGRVEIEMAHRA
jgi:hypothetical protein